MVWPFTSGWGSDNPTVNITVWPIQNPQDPPSKVFPEQQEGFVVVDDKSVGVACSGGGSRSHTLCAGYFRAMRDLSVSSKVTYISSVSGGSWASSIYTFAKMDDMELLGQPTKPEDCTIHYLKTADPGKLGSVLVGFWGVLTALVQLIAGLSTSRLWQRMIGHTLLKPFGLHRKLMAHDEEHVKQILEKNKKNKLVQRHKNDFVIPKEGRPYLIINAALAGPDGHSTGWGNTLQFTPIYAGVPFYRNMNNMYYMPVTFFGSIINAVRTRLGLINPLWLNELYIEQMLENKTEGLLGLTIGGGVVDSFAFGTKLLKLEPHYFGAPEADGEVETNQLFFLEDGVGASSAAYVAAFENLAFGFHVAPLADYFPVLSRGSDKFSKLQAPTRLLLADGGTYDNTGVLPLLQRGVKKLICFINSPVPLDMDFQVNNFNNEPKPTHTDKFEMVKTLLRSHRYYKEGAYYCADTQFLALFGAVKIILMNYNYTANQVFETKKLNDVMLGLIDSINKGKGGVTKHTLKVVENKNWNIAGGYEVEVLFFYNEHCYDFEKKLPKQTQAAMKNGWDNLSDFPFYRTMFQSIRPFSLDLKQVNILASQAEYVMKANEDLVKSMFE